MSDHRADDMDVTPDVETGNMDRLLDRLDELTSAQGAPVRILLVEDEDQPREVLRKMIEAIIPLAEVVEAPSLAVARAEVVRGQWALVVLDLLLRDGHGAVLVNDMRSAGMSVPILCCSGRYYGEDFERMATELFRMGVVAFLRKPVTLEELRIALRLSGAHLYPCGDCPKLTAADAKRVRQLTETLRQMEAGGLDES